MDILQNQKNKNKLQPEVMQMQLQQQQNLFPKINRIPHNPNSIAHAKDKPFAIHQIVKILNMVF